jgi:hypothetical protein
MRRFKVTADGSRRNGPEMEEMGKLERRSNYILQKKCNFVA